MSDARSAAADIDVDLRQLFAGMARNWLRILGVALVAAGLALAFVWTATPKYRSETRLLIETRESVFTRPDAGAGDRPILDEEGVTSQVEVISSTDILKQVAEKLGLAKLPEFAGADTSFLRRLLVVAGLKSDTGAIPPEEQVLGAMRERLNVYRVEKSRVIVIEFSSRDPRLAAEIPNAIADTYIAALGSAKLESNTAATDWLAPEIEDLSRRVKEAEARVAEYRAHSDLLLGQNNSVLVTQQLSELSSELSRVRADRAVAEATTESARRALQGGGSLDAIPEVLSSTLIQRLRERQLQLRSDIADLSTTLLGNHPRIRALKSQLSDLDRQIRVEAEKVLTALTTQAQTAQARESQLVAEVNRLKAQSARAGEQEVELNALEREANAQRQLLESYMTRYREASSRQDRNYLPVDARVFSRAVVPSEPYFPKVVPTVGAAFVGALLAMAVLTLLIELFSGRAMRPAAGAGPEPVREVAMPPVPVPVSEPVPEPEAVAALPEADPEPEPEPAAVVQDASQPQDAEEPVMPPPQTDPGEEINVEKAAEKLIASAAERAVFISPEGDEAAASSILVARAVSDAGLRVILVDLTASGAASRAMLESAVFAGITNLLSSEAQFSDVIHTDRFSDCHIIPVGTASPMRAMRAADRLPIIMQSLTMAYDLVVVECGPTDAQGVRRVVGEHTEVFVSVLEARQSAADATARLIENGFRDVTLVSPDGQGTPGAPWPGRSAA
jgi:exopolysaccharide transport family protein